MSWIAVGTAAVGAAVSIGTQAYASSQTPDFGGAAPIPFKPIDVASTVQQGINTDIQGYDLSDADFLKRFPGLVSTRSAQISDAKNQLTGPLDPTVQNAFTKQGVIQALGSTGGGGNIGANIGGAGSIGQNTAAVSLANSVLGKQDSDRAYLDSLIASNPQRAFGVTGSGAASLEIQNAQNTNAYNLQKYAYDTQKNAAGGGGGF